MLDVPPDLLLIPRAIDFVDLCSRVPVENELSFAMVLGQAPFDHVRGVVRSAPALHSRSRDIIRHIKVNQYWGRQPTFFEQGVKFVRLSRTCWIPVQNKPALRII